MFQKFRKMYAAFSDEYSEAVFSYAGINPQINLYSYNPTTSIWLRQVVNQMDLT